jgi:voltage-gated potassium channel Kch
MSSRKPTVGQRLRYAFDNTMSKGTPALVGWLAVATIALIVVFSVVTLIFNLAPQGDGDKRPGVIRQTFNTLLHAMDAGTIAGDTGNWKFLVVMLLLTLGGIFIFSALIGVIATGLDNQIQRLRKGRSFVIERDHTLILGWSETIFTVVRELVVANENEKNPVIVILADRDKVEMEDMIRDKVEALASTRVVCRSGSPIDMTDLGIVNPHEARSIIVLGPEGEEPDAQVIKTILALTKGPNRRDEPYRIVAEIEDPKNLGAARLVGGSEAVLIDARETIARLIVQTCRQSGLSVVYTELLDFDGDEIYFRADPSLIGRTYGEALLAYEDCTIMGLESGGGVKVNPPADTPIRESDRVIAIAEDDSRLDAAVANFEPSPNGAGPSHAGGRPQRPERVLLIGWNHRGPSVVRELDHYVAPGSEVHVVSALAEAESDLAREHHELHNLGFTFEVADTTDRRTLDALDAPSYDHVIVLAYADALTIQEADARTLVTLLHLRDIVSLAGAQVSIVSEMLDDRNRTLAEVTQVDDVIVSDRLISLMLAQISENEQLEDVFNDMFDASGSEVYLRPVEEYLQPGEETTFRAVVERARTRGETAIGYRRRALHDDAGAQYGVKVNPVKSTPLKVERGDRVIVFAEG